MRVAKASLISRSLQLHRWLSPKKLWWHEHSTKLSIYSRQHARMHGTCMIFPMKAQDSFPSDDPKERRTQRSLEHAGCDDLCKILDQHWRSYCRGFVTFSDEPHTQLQIKLQSVTNAIVLAVTIANAFPFANSVAMNSTWATAEQVLHWCHYRALPPTARGGGSLPPPPQARLMRRGWSQRRKYRRYLEVCPRLRASEPPRRRVVGPGRLLGRVEGPQPVPTPADPVPYLGRPSPPRPLPHSPVVLLHRHGVLVGDQPPQGLRRNETLRDGSWRVFLPEENVLADDRRDSVEQLWCLRLGLDGILGRGNRKGLADLETWNQQRCRPEERAVQERRFGYKPKRFELRLDEACMKRNGRQSLTVHGGWTARSSSMMEMGTLKVIYM